MAKFKRIKENGNNMAEDIKKMTQCLDNYLIENNMLSISAPEANKILEEADLLNDSIQRPGKPLRELLRAGYFPHAYKNNGRWVIPCSENVSVKLHSQGKKNTADENNNSRNILPEDIKKLEKKLEDARTEYKPDKIKYLLVAQAPPDNIERFFYYTNVTNRDYLFLGVIGVLYPEDKIEFLESGRNADIKNSILLKFKEDGFFLIDLSELPISYATKSLKSQLPTLEKKVQKLTDEDTKIIPIKCDVYDIAFSFLNERFKNVIDARIPFPGSGNQEKFNLKFIKALKLADYYIINGM